MNRFWPWIAAAFASGILLAEYSAYPTLPISLGLMLCSITAALLLPRISRRQQWAIAFAFAGVGVLYAELLKPQSDTDPLYSWCQSQIAEGRNLAQVPPVTLEGVVRKADIILPDSEYATFILDADTFETRGKRHNIASRVRVVWAPPKSPVYPGQRVRVEGPLKNRLGTFNFGIQGIETYYHQQGVFTSMTLPLWSRVEVLGSNPYSAWHWIGRMRQTEALALRDAIPAKALPFVYTVWLGEKRGIAADEYEKYMNTGTAHILAVSGVHVGIIYLSLAMLLGQGLRNRKSRALIIILAVWLFALLAGARVSSVRAATMITLYLLAEFFDREPDAPTTLGQSAFLFLFLQPSLLFDLGFLLSFGSVASLMLFSTPISNLFGKSAWWLKSNVSPTLAVQILPFPLVSGFFNVFPLISPAINLLVIPLLSVVLWLCLFTALFAFIVPPIAPLFGYAIQPVVALIESIVQLASQLPGAYLWITSPTPLSAALYWCGVGALAYSLSAAKKKKRFTFLGVCFLVLCAIFWHPYQSPGVDFLDVGHGDAAFVRTPGGTTMLIDGGDRSDYADYGERVVAPYLYKHGVTHLDYMVMTHPDRDHVGGLLHTLENVSVGMVLLPAVPSDRELEKILLALCAEKNIPVQRCKTGDTVICKGATIDVLWPDGRGKSADVNENSLVLRVRWPGMDALFTGDIEAGAEASLAKTDCGADVLKVPHHGSHTSSAQSFLEAVNPSIAVVSTQGGSRRNAVHPDVQARYGAMNIPLFRTDQSGGVRIRQDGETLYFQSARKFYGYDLDPMP